MTATPNTDQSPAQGLRAGLQNMWATVAPAWGEYAGDVDARGEAQAERLLDLAGPCPGERVLELACGPGGLGLAAAARVAPDGEVVLSDVAAAMTAIAAERAAAAGLGVTTRVLDLEEIDEPGDSYDVVLCREGLMFAVDPAGAVGEIARVLRPGGRVALAVWGPRERNPWLGAVLDSLSDQLGAPFPPPGVPGPFSLGDDGALAGLLAGAGLRNVVVEELPVAMGAESFEAWWTRTIALAGPLATVVGGLPEAAGAELRERARSATAAYATADGLDLPGVALLAAGRRAD